MRLCATRMLLVLAALAVSTTLPARAGEETDPGLAAAKAARAKLPAPTPAISVTFDGDSVIQGLWAGEVQLTARLARLGRRYVWRVTSTSFTDWKGGELRTKTMLHLDNDLSILSGTYDRDQDGKQLSLAFARNGNAYDVQRRTKTGDAWSKPETLSVKTPAGVMGALPTLFLFLRAVPPEKGGRYILPWISVTDLGRQEKELEPGQLVLTVKGKGQYDRGKKKIPTWVVGYRIGMLAMDIHFSRDRRSLVALAGDGMGLDIRPKGAGGERITADPKSAATTWKQAFLKFGFGYHMARRALLAEAFHWDAMYEHETKVLKRWPKDQPVEEFKKAWIQEFVNNSKHRDVPGTRRLLAMTIATGKVKKQTDKEVVFWAHPNFGGGTQKTYHFRKVNDVWGIVRIDL